MRKDIYIKKDDLWIWEKIVAEGKVPEWLQWALQKWIEEK